MADSEKFKFADLTDKSALEEGREFGPKFDSDGLVPAIVTDQHTGEVLMFAWMNRDALLQTLSTKFAHFWSRSRKKLWKKGEESGNLLQVHEILTDCDQDVVWLRVSVLGAGVACHTKRRSCFYRAVAMDPAVGGTVSLEFNSSDDP